MSRHSTLGVLRNLGVGVVLVLLAWPWWPPPARPATEGATLVRWLGPVASLASSFELVRWNTALRRGEPERAYTLAGRALALDPRSPMGWLDVGQHLILDRSSAEMERDPKRRAAWARAGLDLLRRGEERSVDPAALAVIGGDLAGFLAERTARDLTWPGGAEALLDEARASYERAERHGHPEAAERLSMLARVRARGAGDLATREDEATESSPASEADAGDAAGPGTTATKGQKGPRSDKGGG